MESLMLEREIQKVTQLNINQFNNINTTQLLAHEVRNPLSTIRLYISLLKENPDKINELQFKNIFDRIDQNIEQVNQIINNVVLYHKTGKLQKTQFDLKVLIDELVMDFQGIFLKGTIKFECEVEFKVVAARSSIKQVLSNLIINAIEITEYKGTLEIKLKYEKDSVKCEVYDNGPGVDEFSLNKLFNPYYTRKDNGTGLGLALVAQVISQHNSEYGAFNTDQGACFWFTLKQE
jgi:signal transduction histidine kinase